MNFGRRVESRNPFRFQEEECGEQSESLQKFILDNVHSDHSISPHCKMYDYFKDSETYIEKVMALLKHEIIEDIRQRLEKKGDESYQNEMEVTLKTFLK